MTKMNYLFHRPVKTIIGFGEIGSNHAHESVIVIVHGSPDYDLQGLCCVKVLESAVLLSTRVASDLRSTSP
jgi:hypothetical protein